MPQDIFPQFEVATLTMTVANTAVTVEVDFPNDLVDGEVLEITKLVLYTPGVEFPAAVSIFHWWVDVQTRTGVVNFPDPDLVYRISQGASVSDITAESGTVVFDRVIEKDLTDGQGRGHIVPADKLFVLLDTANYSGTPEFILRIYYRIVKVSSREVLEYLTSA